MKTLAFLTAAALALPTAALADDCSTKKAESAQYTPIQSTQVLDANATDAKIYMAGNKYKMAKSDIVDTAVEAGQFNTLVAAVQAAGLVDTLKGDGPFTVFAPTDAAFAALPDGTVESLLLPENRDTLTSILTYHVVPGKVKAKNLSDGLTATTVNGMDVTFDLSDGAMVNGASIVKTDIYTSNGVIHVIDSVLLPEPGHS